MRPSVVVLIAFAAAVAGAAGAVVAGQTGGWLNGGTRTTVVVRDPLDSVITPPPIVISKPLVANGFQPTRIYNQRISGVVTIFAYFPGKNGGSQSLDEGAGFVVSKSGYVMTAAHVIAATNAASGKGRAASKVFVQFASGDRVRAQIVGWDPFDDVGIVKVDPAAHALVPVPLGTSAQVKVGEPVAAIGTPFGIQNTLSIGIVSATRRTIPSLTTAYDLVDAIQTDAPINRGNSGGPLFDSKGLVIGLYAQMRTGRTGFQGVSFAIPIDSAKRSFSQLVVSGRVSYAYAGIKTENLTPTIARQYGYSVKRGALIDVVTPGTGAEKAGLRAGTQNVIFANQAITLGGDVIIGIGGLPVASADDVIRIISARFLPGEVARFTIVRHGHRLVVPVTLGERPLNGG